MNDGDLEQAQRGDAAAFARLVGPHRRELTAHCYRMTGSLAQAEDVVQESLVRAWRGLGSFAGRSSLRTWLYRIATNACLSTLERRPERLLPDDRREPSPPSEARTPPDLEPVWLEPAPDELWSDTTPPDARYGARESVALAFLAALQHLPSQQRAVLLLRDVLGFGAAETAELLETSEAAANSALQRARSAIEARRDRLATSALAPDDTRTAALLRRYIDAWETGDMRLLVSVLRDDARMTMPPIPTWLRGASDIVAFLSAIGGAMGAARARVVSAAGAPAVAVWLQPPGAEGFAPHAIHVLTVADDARAAAVDIFMDASLFERFGLPATP